MKRTRKPTPPATPPARAEQGHTTTVTWQCCGVIFETTPAIIEHLRNQHGVDSFQGRQTLSLALDDEDLSTVVYKCTIGGVTLTKTVTTVKGGAPCPS